MKATLRHQLRRGLDGCHRPTSAATGFQARSCGAGLRTTLKAELRIQIGITTRAFRRWGAGWGSADPRQPSWVCGCQREPEHQRCAFGRWSSIAVLTALVVSGEWRGQGEVCRCPPDQGVNLAWFPSAYTQHEPAALKRSCGPPEVGGQSVSVVDWEPKMSKLSTATSVSTTTPAALAFLPATAAGGFDRSDQKNLCR